MLRRVTHGIRLPDPATGDSLNAVLRTMRQEAGLSLDTLAARTNFSKSYLSNIEAGRRRVTRQIAEAYDVILGLSDLLTRLVTEGFDPLVGRTAELARLRHLVADVAAGRGRAVWLQGEPGIGKTALLRIGLGGAAAAGCRVFSAAADESLARFPLYVMLECLEIGSADRDPERAQISALLRGEGSTGLPPADAVVVAAERLLLLVERCTAESPVVLVVDDLQWADEVSLSVWGRLRRLVRQVPLLLVGACRPVPRRAELATLRRGMTGPETVLLDLAPLAPPETGEVIGRLAGAPPGPRLAAAAAQAAGNPLYLRELLDALLREERIEVRDGAAELSGPLAGAGLPQSLTAAIATRLDFLSEQTRRILRVAALLGPTPTVADIRMVTGHPASDLAEWLDEAIAAGVLVPSGTGLAFRHGLIRQVLSEQMPLSLRVELHRQAAHAMAQAGTPVERVAEQLLAGSVYAEDWIPGWLAGGAATTLTHRAPAAAVELVTAALDRMPADDPHRDNLAVCQATGLFLLGRYPDVVRLGQPLLDRIADGEDKGRLAWTVAYALAKLVRPDEGLAVVARATQGPAGARVPDPWLSRLRAYEAMALGAVGRVDEGWCIAEEVLAREERGGDPTATGYALHAMSVSCRRRDDEPAALALMDRALGIIGDRPETADLHCMVLGNRMMALHNLGRLAELSPAVGEALAAAERAGAMPRLVGTRAQVANLYFQLGRWDDAAAEVAAVADLIGSDVVQTVWCRAIGALIAVHRENWTALREHLAAVQGLDLKPDETRHIGRWMDSAVAMAAEAEGHPDQALDRYLAVCFLPTSTAGAPAVDENCVLWLPDVVRLASATGRATVASAVTQACVALADKDGRPRSRAVSLHCQGLLVGEPAVLETAAAGYARGGYVLYRAHALEDRAVLLAQRGDPDGARKAYREAADVYTRLDAAWDLRRAASRLDPLGVRRRAYQRRPAKGWAALTPTERKVAALVAKGLSNPDIATRLMVSRRTVETHVAHILAKIDGHSRTEIAREAERRGRR
jgi:DNA-binding CsgD family transcriptional regulator/transcriptional regulator with XRE-family HTH domain